MEQNKSNAYPDKEEWLQVVKGILIEHGYREPLDLCPDAWGELFEEGLHPVAAVVESEGMSNIRANICYSRFIQQKEVNNGAE